MGSKNKNKITTYNQKNNNNKQQQICSILAKGAFSKVSYLSPNFLPRAGLEPATLGIGNQRLNQPRYGPPHIVNIVNSCNLHFD